MAQPFRGILTFLSVAGAGFLIWLSTQAGQSVGAYWAKIGVLAAAGLVLPLAQLFGGWTKWGWPRFSPHVVVLGFLPALLIAGWVIVTGQPDDNWFQRHLTSWSGDLHVARIVRHLRETYLDVLAFGLGVVFGFSFDTTGPRRATAPASETPGEENGETKIIPASTEETAVTRVDERKPDEAETQVTTSEKPPPEA